MINTFSIDNHNITFVNESKNTRNGFKHVSDLYLDGSCYPISTGVRYYLNRTWEYYQYQSSMIEAVEQLIAEKTADIKRNLKERNGWKIINDNRYKVVNAAVENDEQINFYNSILEHLKSHCLN